MKQLRRLLCLLLCLALCSALFPAARAEDEGIIALVEDPEGPAEDGVPDVPEEETPSEGGTIAPAPEEPDAPAPEDDPEAVYEGSCGAGMNWRLDTSTGVLTISGSGKMNNYKADSPAPWYDYSNYITTLEVSAGVTSIGEYAFYDLRKLDSVSLPATLASIGDYAFSNCTALNRVSIPAGVTEIGFKAFYGCSHLYDINVSLDNPVYSSYYSLLYDKSQTTLLLCAGGMSSVVFAESMTAIGDYAFSGMPYLRWIELPAGVTRIGEGAFEDCAGMGGVFFRGGAPEIGNDCFLNVTADVFYPADDSSWTEEVRQNYGGRLTWLSSSQCGPDLCWSFDEETGVLTITGSGDMLDYGKFGNISMPPWNDYRERITIVVLPEGLTSIGNLAFCNHYNLENVSIPDSVTRIGDYAFYSCGSLTSVTIPGSVTSIGGSAFASCKNLTSVTIPEGLTSIEDNTFNGCKALERVTLPEGLTSIGDNAFNGCSSLPGVTLPAGVTRIGKGAFLNCHKLSSITLPEGLTEIGNNAFGWCYGLKGMTIPASVTSIGEGAFYQCQCMRYIMFLGSAPQLGYYIFGDCPVTAYYPAGDPSWTEALRQSCVGTITWVALIGMGRCGDELTWGLSEGGDMIVSGDGPMWDYGGDSPAPWADLGSRIQTLRVGEGVTGIGDGAFDGIGAGFTEITFPDSLQSIGRNAFRGCGSLESVWFPAGLTAVGAEAFGACGSLSWILFLGSAPEIAPDAFASDSASVYYPGEDVSWTEELRADYGGALTWVSFLDGGQLGTGTALLRYWLYTADHVLFIYGKGKMENFAYDEEAQRGKTPWAEYTEEIEALVVKEGITSLGDESFDQCVNLSKVSLPEGLDSIGQYALCGTAITGITLPASLQSIGEGALCLTPLESITFPRRLTALGAIALAGNTALTSITFEGSAPSFGDFVFAYDTAAAYYPAENSTWTKKVCQDYGGSITWVPCLDGKPVPNVFTDVSSGKYYFAPVLWAYYHDPRITGGTGDGTTFSPNAPCTREQIVTFLWAACGCPEPTGSSSPFPDVKAKHYFYKAVLWAVENGITGGTPDGKFGVGQACTREQAMTFLWVAAGSPEPTGTTSPFTDVKPKHYFYKPVLWAVENGVTSGAGDGKFGVGQPCTRAQIVTFLYQARDFLEP